VTSPIVEEEEDEDEGSDVEDLIEESDDMPDDVDLDEEL
jgi:hypothetical protein